ncbi:hypothetical protein CONPUDRAFT_162631 [Coniophora puteana RWD-64-598 SS2]|uniref:Uncharacterized protein n=1 Tax=Coniophora puteana (strain RWD-64-598) TaxID=741705 RepID=A0A5M3N220_CONPW|nr:uncharacterized protein CONPUDRAFT_162631 [Coniophora puteana RWD-64-598 SS2]EIW85433.1 hypothetical protein CONPUDRAFT_162631 [Coniophora puteana RWD-64-598 SS2]
MARDAGTARSGRRSDAMKSFMTSLGLRPTDAEEFDAIKSSIRKIALSVFVQGLGASEQSDQRWSTFKTHVLDHVPILVAAPPRAYECLYDYTSKFLATRKHGFKRRQARLEHSVAYLDSSGGADASHRGPLTRRDATYRLARARTETQTVPYERSPSLGGEPEPEQPTDEDAPRLGSAQDAGTQPVQPPSCNSSMAWEPVTQPEQPADEDVLRLSSAQDAGAQPVQPPSCNSPMDRVVVTHTDTRRASSEEHALHFDLRAHTTQITNHDETVDDESRSASRPRYRSSETAVALSCRTTSAQPEDVSSDAAALKGNQHNPEYSEQPTAEGTWAVRAFLNVAKVPHLIPLFLSLGVFSTTHLDVLTKYDTMRRTRFFGPNITYMDAVMLEDAFEERKNRGRQAQGVAAPEQMESDEFIDDSEKTDEAINDGQSDV